MSDISPRHNAEYALLPPHLERLINAYTKAVIGEAIEAGHALTDGFQLTVSAASDVVLDKVKNRHWIGFKMRGVFQGKRQWEAWRGSLYSAVDHRGRSWPSLLDAVYEFIEKPEWAAGQIALIDGPELDPDEAYGVEDDEPLDPADTDGLIAHNDGSDG